MKKYSHVYLDAPSSHIHIIEKLWLSDDVMNSFLSEEQRNFLNTYNNYIQLAWNKGCEIISEYDETSLQKALECIDYEVAKV